MTVGSMTAKDIISAAPDVGSWAEEVEQHHQRSEVDKDGVKTVVENVVDNGQTYKVTTKYQVISKQVPRVVAERKKWKKFGECSRDAPGPMVSTTYVAEEVDMQFVRNRSGEQILDVQEDKQAAKTTSREHCRHCKASDHWSATCPYKEMYQLEEETEPEAEKDKMGPGGRYVVPGARDGRTLDNRRSDENTCRVTNMPVELEESELRDMFSAIGRVSRVFIARDKVTYEPKGFAFVTFETRQDADRAIQRLNGVAKYHMILKVEWTRSNTN